MAWNTSAAPYDLSAGEKYFAPITITVEPGDGSVQIQLKNSAGTFVTPAAAEYTITAAGPIQLERANTPEMRVIATGTAKFEVTDRQ